MNKPSTVVLGASPTPWRYAHRAVLSLLEHGHDVIPVGKREGSIGSLAILNGIPTGVQVHTVTVYLNNAHLELWREQLLALRPKRLIFNPGAEHREFAEEATRSGIEVVEACTLVMLATGQY